MFEQQIEMFSHGPSKSILDGNHRRLRFLLKHAVEYFGRASTWKHRAGGLHAQSSFMTERTGFALYSYSQRAPHSYFVISRFSDFVIELFRSRRSGVELE